MLQRLIVNGEPEYVEFFPKLIEEKIEDNERSWALVNGRYELRFLEKPLGTYSQLTHVPELVILDEDSTEELKIQIQELLDQYIASQKEGLEPDLEEPKKSYPYDPKLISINNFNWSLDYIFQLLNRGVINLSPDFQRNFVWDSKRQSQLIESILLGIPVPAFYLAKTDKRFYVVDGLQRLTTIKRFMNNEFPLKGLEYLNSAGDYENNLEGKYYKDDKRKRGIGEDYEFILRGTQFNVNVIEGTTPSQVKFDIFRRLNSSGKPLNNQEIRNCMMEDEPRVLINTLANSEEFKRATNRSVSTARMNAQELVMRFIGFWYIRVLKQEGVLYQGDMQSFLDDLIELLNKDNGKYHELIERDFRQSMINSFYLFGDYSFRKCLPKDLLVNARKQLINKSLFTTWSVCLCKFSFNTVQSSGLDNEEFSTFLAKELYGNKEYYDSVTIGTNNKANLDLAFSITEELIKKHLLNG